MNIDDDVCDEPAERRTVRFRSLSLLYQYVLQQTFQVVLRSNYDSTIFSISIDLKYIIGSLGLYYVFTINHQWDTLSRLR